MGIRSGISRFLRLAGLWGKTRKVRAGRRVKEIEFERDTGFPKTRAHALRFGSINSISINCIFRRRATWRAGSGLAKRHSFGVDQRILPHSRLDAKVEVS